ncbi:MAG: cell division protein FtsQ/DivIB [Candidatus Sericytochromatia bacterium]|nr:cell division protein FtsQ/DivIB [Candidatus Sericytochromatia bacterium]
MPDYLGIMAAMVMASCLWMIWTAHFWWIQNIEIRGSSPHTQAWLEQLVSAQNIKGQHVLRLNPLTLKDLAEQNPLVQTAQFERELLPTRLVIKVQERKAAYLILHEKKHYAYSVNASSVIDHEGVVLPLPASHAPKSLLQISADPGLLQTVLPTPNLDLLRQLETLQSQGRLQVDGVFNISNPQNLILHLNERNLKVWLGRAEDLPVKLQLIEASLKTAEKEQADIAYLDLRFWKHPVIKTR